MKRSKLGKALLTAAGLSVLAAGAARAQAPASVDPSQVVVIRESGKPEQRCLIEYAIMRQDGKTMFYVRDLATGERLRVLDNRTNTTAGGPIVGKVMARLNTPDDAGMARALESSPASVKDKPPVLTATANKTVGKATATGTPRTLTAAELAGSTPKPAATQSPKFKPAAPARSTPPVNGASPVQIQLNQLKAGTAPSQREAAATVLAVSDARTMPEVVKALMTAAQADPAASVRTTCVRCLFRISTEVPDVIPVIAARRTDSNPEVARTAAKAMEEIGKRVEAKAGIR